MIRIVTAGALLAALGNAPMQCSHNPDPNLRREDDAGDALYSLAQDFRAKGDEESARHTLKFLLEKYPSNRHAPAARAELGSAPSEPKADAGK